MYFKKLKLSWIYLRKLNKICSFPHWEDMQAHGYFTYPKLEGEISSRMYFRGKKVITWSINNYLGLSNHPEIRKVDTKAASDWGLGTPMGSRMMSGETKVS